MSRETLAPPLMRMGGNRNYRVNLIHEDFGGNPAAQQVQSTAGYAEKDLYTEEDDDIEDASNFAIEELPSSLFKLTMHVAPAFYGGLIGFKGSTKRRIESETQTEIFVPRSREGGGSKNEDVTIKGKARSNVCAARRKINLLTTSLRSRMRPTHFVGVPLNNDEIRTKLEEFKKEILASELPGIEESLFQSCNRLHLTICVCVLLDDAERSKAVELLQECKQYLTDLRTPLKLKVAGLEIMNDDPSAVRILYACVEAPEYQQFANRCYQHFIGSGLSKKEFERDYVKLHLTVMNSKFQLKDEKAKATSFDAREILKKFGDYNFGEAQCDEVHLCVLGSKSEDRGEYYKMTGSLKL